MQRTFGQFETPGSDFLSKFTKLNYNTIIKIYVFGGVSENGTYRADPVVTVKDIHSIRTQGYRTGLAKDRLLVMDLASFYGPTNYLLDNLHTFRLRSGPEEVLLSKKQEL